MLSFKDMIKGRKTKTSVKSKKQKNVPKVVKKQEPTEKIIYKTVKEIQEVPVEKVVEKVVEVPETTTLDSLPFVIGSQVELVHNLNKKNKQIGVVLGYNHETRRCEIQLDGAALKKKNKKKKLGVISDNKKTIIQNNLNENRLLKIKNKEVNNSTTIIKKKTDKKTKNKNVRVKQNKKNFLLI